MTPKKFKFIIFIGQKCNSIGQKNIFQCTVFYGLFLHEWLRYGSVIFIIMQFYRTEVQFYWTEEKEKKAGHLLIKKNEVPERFIYDIDIRYFIET